MQEAGKFELMHSNDQSRRQLTGFLFFGISRMKRMFSDSLYFFSNLFLLNHLTGMHPAMTEPDCATLLPL